jgi:hypothetical protein
VETLSTFYLQLHGCLAGYHIRFEAEAIEDVFEYAKECIGPLAEGPDGMHVYTEAYFMEVLRKRRGVSTRVINNLRPVVLHRQ